MLGAHSHRAEFSEFPRQLLRRWWKWRTSLAFSVPQDIFVKAEGEQETAKFLRFGGVSLMFSANVVRLAGTSGPPGRSMGAASL